MMQPLRTGTAVFLALAGVYCLQAQDLEKHPDVEVFAEPGRLAAGAVTHDWPAFLGPTHDAASTETCLQLDWPESGPKLLWSLAKGSGYASPAICGDYLVYFHRRGDEEEVLCLHPESGGFRWSVSYPSAYRDRYGYNDGPRASPVIEGGRVFTFGAEGKLHCLDLDSGRVLWKRDLLADFAVAPGFFGASATPLAIEEGLIVNLGAPDANVVCLNKETGATVWTADTEWGASYASPVPGVLHGKRRVLLFAGGESRPPRGGLLCIDPADGAIDARFPWRSKKFESVNAASPVVIGQQVFITASYGTGGALLKFSEDLQAVEAVWTSAGFGAHFNTPVHHEGLLYGFDGRHTRGAELVCFRVSDGEQLWREQIHWQEQHVQADGTETELEMSPFRGTLLRVGERFLCLGEFGHLLSLQLDENGPKILSRARLFYAPETWSAPVLSRGLLYISQHGTSQGFGTPRLLCYDLRRQTPDE